jgi:acyl carrier protein
MGLDVVEIVMSVEEHFGIEIPDDIAGTLTTVGSLHDYVVAELARQNRHPVDADAVFAQIREIICDQIGIESERVVPDAGFVQDLDID